MSETNNIYNNVSERERRDSAMSGGSRYSTGSTSVANKKSSKETKPEIKKDKQNTQVWSYSHISLSILELFHNPLFV